MERTEDMLRDAEYFASLMNGLQLIDMHQQGRFSALYNQEDMLVIGNEIEISPIDGITNLQTIANMLIQRHIVATREYFNDINISTMRRVKLVTKTLNDTIFSKMGKTIDDFSNEEIAYILKNIAHRFAHWNISNSYNVQKFHDYALKHTKDMAKQDQNNQEILLKFLRQAEDDFNVQQNLQMGAKILISSPDKTTGKKNNYEIFLTPTDYRILLAGLISSNNHDREADKQDIYENLFMLTCDKHFDSIEQFKQFVLQNFGDITEGTFYSNFCDDQLKIFEQIFDYNLAFGNSSYNLDTLLKTNYEEAYSVLGVAVQHSLYHSSFDRDFSFAFIDLSYMCYPIENFEEHKTSKYTPLEAFLGVLQDQLRYLNKKGLPKEIVDLVKTEDFFLEIYNAIKIDVPVDALFQTLRNSIVHSKYIIIPDDKNGPSVAFFDWTNDSQKTNIKLEHKFTLSERQIMSLTYSMNYAMFVTLSGESIPESNK